MLLKEKVSPLVSWVAVLIVRLLKLKAAWVMNTAVQSRPNVRRGRKRLNDVRADCVHGGAR